MGGRGKAYTGIEPRGDSIRITFHYQGRRRRETLKLKPNDANLRHAARLRDTILYEIGIGSFNYAQHFPESSYVKENYPEELRELQQAEECEIITFSDMAHRWLRSQSHLAKGTLTKYRQDLARLWLPIFGELDITKIRYSRIAEVVGEIAWTSEKARNNALIPLRQVFDMAWRDELLNTNPTERIENQTNHKPPPDPFSQDEIALILDYMQKHFDEQVFNYFGAAFYTGMRTEEQIAVCWSDFDERKRTLRIQKAFSYGELKQTKTGKIRDIDLNDQAMGFILAQKKHTFLAGKHIFINPNTGNAWASQAKQRVRYWMPAIKKLGIRYRPPKNTRHSYATLMLMAGCNPAYAASQLGHSLQVFFKDYTRWINDQKQQIEQSKLQNFLSSAPSLPHSLQKQS